jgi:glycosyltransferase involved in cell wall biosynthesis
MKVLYIGLSGFPKASASIEKQKLILKIFQSNNYIASIFCKKNFYEGNYPYKGEVEGINYFYTTFSFRKRKNPFENRFRQFFSQFVEKFLILKNIPDIAIISSRSFAEILSYHILFRFTKTKTLLTHVEDTPSVSKSGIISSINNILFDRYAFRLINGALPISDFLSEKITYFAPKCPSFKLPVLVNYELFQRTSVSIEFSKLISFNYFLYCGSAAYSEVIQFIKLSYEKANSSFKLILILNGHPKEILNMRRNYESDNIVIYSDIDFANLIYLYKNSKALLIPLRETTQDKARFPHKIGEYCASAKPIITNNWGEIPNYFTHLTNAYICNKYDTNEYAKAMKFIEQNPLIADKIGANSLLLAKQQFDFSVYVTPLLKFVDSIYK